MNKCRKENSTSVIFTFSLLGNGATRALGSRDFRSKMCRWRSRRDHLSTPEKERDPAQSASLRDQQHSAWPTVARGPGPCPGSCSRPSSADAEVRLPLGSGPIRYRDDVWPPFLHRDIGTPSCPGCPTGTCIGSQSRSRTGSGALPPPTGSAGWNPSTGSGTVSWAAGRSAGSGEGSSTCPVKIHHDNTTNHLTAPWPMFRNKGFADQDEQNRQQI